ncbi:hypothetical protein [Ferviditalea candida]|uniref:Uncharacterized protein n=1 Tax=Ferviditalea candida TaxID=3108399 RepID=A0ABU5ZNA7_9BACL|nr:hypothetical protein [Paenibacillaceae bacterium T2]
MDETKRMVDSYEVQQEILIGKVEVLLGIDQTKSDSPYMVCYCTRNNSLGVEQFYEAAMGADYLEAMNDFISRVQQEINELKAERASFETSMSPFTKEQCQPIKDEMRIDNQVVVIRSERLRPEYHTANHQLVLALSGFGTHAYSRGRAVYALNLYSGEEIRWNREDILGIIKPEHMPEWAKDTLNQHKVDRQNRQNNRETAR